MNQLAHILSVGTSVPPFDCTQEQTERFVENFFQNRFPDMDRLLRVFQDVHIQKRHFSAPLEWFAEEHTFQEKNDRYQQIAVALGIASIKDCLANSAFLHDEVSPEEIDGIIYISTTGLATPSIEAKIMNAMPFRSNTKRIPIWGLGCAGGAAGLARAYEFCKAYPESAVLVLCVELCSLTFQSQDQSKSNLIGTSLFADGAACVLVAGEQSIVLKKTHRTAYPRLMGTETTLMPNSEDVMGWEIKEGGLHVIFSKSIPSLVENWLRPIMDHFLEKLGLTSAELSHFIAHPGGRKVLEAYQKALNLTEARIEDAKWVLQNYGNMSSPTVLFVLNRVMRKSIAPGETAVVVSLGPGFSSEMVGLKWEEFQ